MSAIDPIEPYISPLMQAYLLTRMRSLRGVPMAPMLPVYDDEKQRLHPDYKTLLRLQHAHPDAIEPIEDPDHHPGTEALLFHEHRLQEHNLQGHRLDERI